MPVMEHFQAVLVLLTLVTTGFAADYPQVCLSGMNHKAKPGPEDSLHSQCSPWKKNSCCTKNTTEALHGASHLNFNFSHCSEKKPMGQECRRHFIQDSCFYECSPNVGQWFVKVDMNITKQRFRNVPLCASNCTAWFKDCKDEYTCKDNWIGGWKWVPGLGNQCPDGTACATFQTVFHNSTNFCQQVWNHSWLVTNDNKPCMRLWFNGSENPNDEVAKFYWKRSRASGLAAHTFALILLAAFSLNY